MAIGCTQDLSADFSTPEGARKVVKLKAFSKFENTTEALAAAAALVDSKLSKGVYASTACANSIDCTSTASVELRATYCFCCDMLFGSVQGLCGIVQASRNS